MIVSETPDLQVDFEKRLIDAREERVYLGHSLRCCFS